MLLAALTASPGPAMAGGLTNTETFGGFEFNFNNPGARALGMGSAFVSVADDATAAVTNPAGLVLLQRPELSAEAKFTTFKNKIKAFSNQPTPDLTRGTPFTSRTFEDDVTTPSFFSFVYPTERLSVAVFAREQINFRSEFFSEGVFIFDPTFPTLLARVNPVKSRLEVTAFNIGAGVGLDLAKTHPLLPNIGFSIEASHGIIKARLDRFRPPDPIGPPSFTDDRRTSTRLVDGTDLSWTVNVGLLWKPTKDFSAGAVYRRGPRFETTITREDGPFFNGALVARDIDDFALKVPDVIAGGISYRFFDRLTVAVDVVHIFYSQLLNGFALQRTSLCGEGGGTLFSTCGEFSPSDFELKDKTEIHVGAEYVHLLPAHMLVALRAGFHTNPDHKIRYTGSRTASTEAAAMSVLFPGGKNVYHYTFGIGFSPIPGVNFDFAINRSSALSEFAASVVLRF